MQLPVDFLIPEPAGSGERRMQGQMLPIRLAPTLPSANQIGTSPELKLEKDAHQL